MSKLILIGFMGSGKTTVGRILAESLQYKFIDCDEEILKRTNYKSVADIFAKEGEAFFRECEYEVAKSIKEQPGNLIVATGGGMIMNERNREALSEAGTIVYLKTDFNNIKSRVEDEIKQKSLTRPLFSDPDAARKLFESRLPVYEKSANLAILTDGKNPAEVAKEIKKNYERMPHYR